MFHCDGCWDSPCRCEDARGYRHLYTDELIKLRDALNRLLVERESQPEKLTRAEPTFVIAGKVYS